MYTIFKSMCAIIFPHSIQENQFENDAKKQLENSFETKSVLKNFGKLQL